jgi:dTDP-D-glucose 4,6-dehydratase
MSTLGWAPQVTMEDALRKIFESYRQKVLEARALLEAGN